MELKVKDIMELLQVSEKTVYKWIEENRIPAYKVHHQYRFNKSEIREWVLKNSVKVSSKILDMADPKSPVRLAELLARGGVLYDVPGESIIDVIKSAVSKMNVPGDITRDEMILSLLEREEMMPTAVGKGIAIPHPRNPVIADVENESITICFPDKSIPYGAVDEKPVHTLFIVLSAKPTRHLEILSKISFLCQHDSFIALLEKKADPQALSAFMRDQESEWERRRRPHE